MPPNRFLAIQVSCGDLGNWIVASGSSSSNKVFMLMMQQ